MPNYKSSTRNRFAYILGLTFGVLTISGAQSHWSSGGGDLSNSRNASTENKISTANVGSLAVKWIFSTQGDVSATPTVKDGLLYAVDWGGYLHCVDAATGLAVWSKSLSDYSGNIGGFGPAGPIKTISRTSPVIHGDLVLIGDQGDLDAYGFPSGNIFAPRPASKAASIMAINRYTGDLAWRTAVSTHAFGAVTSSPVVHGNSLYAGVCSLEEGLGALPFPAPYSFRGKVVSLNANTGALQWETYMTPAGYAGVAVWGSTPVVDVKRGSLYVATGNNYAVPAGAPETTGGLTPGNFVDALVALDLSNGAIKWGNRLQGADTWNLSQPQTPLGPDYDFGSGPNLFTVKKQGKKVDLLGAGQKSGKYWALNPDNGSVVWSTQVGPGGLAGGIQWGSAVDGDRVYCAVSNSNNVSYSPMGGGPNKSAGLWAGLDAATGQKLWETPDPLDYRDFGMVTVANSVVFAGSTSGKMYAMNAATGSVLWSYDGGGSVICGPAVVDGVVYWGTGYGRFFGAFGTPGVNRLYAFQVP